MQSITVTQHDTAARDGVETGIDPVKVCLLPTTTVSDRGPTRDLPGMTRSLQGNVNRVSNDCLRAGKSDLSSPKTNDPVSLTLYRQIVTGRTVSLPTGPVHRYRALSYQAATCQ